MERNLTTGSVLRNILYFSLPYLLSYFLQTLYGMADLFIIGQFEGSASTTAVSVGSQVMHMITVMIVGLAMGSTVSIGRSIGAGEHKRVSAIIGNTVSLFMVVSVGLMAVLLLLVQPIVTVMSTPAEAVAGTRAYLTICFIGIPCITAYNIISSIFRGLGDSKSPMYFIAVACVANIALDYLFIGAMGLGPAGAALGTTLSQAISVVVSLVVILKRKTGISLHRADLKLRRPVLRQVLKIGLPVAFQDGFIQIAFIVITIIANRRGLNDAAAVGIVEKVISFLFLVPSSMLSTVSALGAQNIGAGKHDRTVLTLRYAFRISAGFGTQLHQHRDAVDCRTGGEPVHHRSAGHHRGWAVHPRLHLGLPVRGHPFQFQRLLLRVRPVGNFLPAQHLRHPDHAYSRCVSDVHPVPGYVVPDGPGYCRRLHPVDHHLRGRLYLSETARCL